MDKTYNIISDNTLYGPGLIRTVNQQVQLNYSIKNWVSRSGSQIDSNFVLDGNPTSNIWGTSTYRHLTQDLAACITAPFRLNSLTEWYRNEWNYRWGIPIRAYTKQPVQVTGLSFQFGNRNSDNASNVGYWVEMFAGLGGYGTTKLVSDTAAWYSPHTAGQQKNYTINTNAWYDHFMIIVSCQGNSYHDRVGIKNAVISGKILDTQMNDISSQGIKATEKIVSLIGEKV